MSIRQPEKLTPPPLSAAEFTACRLRPGADLRWGLEDFFAATGREAGFIAAAVGSLYSATLRLANAEGETRKDGPFEIVSLSGAFSVDGPHLHLSLADRGGRLWGGHLLPGCPAFTTAEIVLGLLPGLRFHRPVDPETGWRELAIEQAMTGG